MGSQNQKIEFLDLSLFHSSTPRVEEWQKIARVMIEEWNEECHSESGRVEDCHSSTLLYIGKIILG